VNGHAWRRKFIELAEDVFRELGFPPPSMLHEESLPLAMELEIESIPFELLHSSADQVEFVLVICKLGPLPSGIGISGIRRLLQSNLVLARTHEAFYGVNPDTSQIQCMFQTRLMQVTAVDLLAKMRQISLDSLQWKKDFFSIPSLKTSEVSIAHQILA
jgi:hypothetical protein